MDEPRRPGDARPARLRAAGGHRPRVRSRPCDTDAAGVRRAISSRSNPHAAGREILGNFLSPVVTARGAWQLGDFAEQAIDHSPARRQRRVICGLSGGVDSSVVAALLYKAIGPQLSCILVDNGMLRKDEARGDSRVLGPLPNRPARGPRRGAFWPRWPASPIRRRSAGASAGSSSNASPTRRPRSTGLSFWPRGRSIPT